MDLLPSAEEPFRSERLRELVDRLEPASQELISAVFFGQEPLTHAARRLDMPISEAKGVMARALKTLRRQVLNDHDMGSMPTTRR